MDLHYVKCAERTMVHTYLRESPLHHPLAVPGNGGKTLTIVPPCELKCVRAGGHLSFEGFMRHFLPNPVAANVEITLQMCRARI